MLFPPQAKYTSGAEVRKFSRNKAAPGERAFYVYHGKRHIGFERLKKKGGGGGGSRLGPSVTGVPG